MRIKIPLYCLPLLLLLNQAFLFGQARYEKLDSLLAVRSQEIPALNEKVSISVSDVSIEEFLRGVANSSGLNLDVQPGLNFKVINNFSDVRVRDMLVYICKQFDLDLIVVGNIISVVKLSDTKFSSSEAVKWDQTSQRVIFDFSNVPVEQAAREITLKTKTNVILAPGASGKTVNGYIEGQPLKNALEKLAYSNGMLLRQTEDNFYILEQKPQAVQVKEEPRQERPVNRRNSGSTRNKNEDFELTIETTPEGLINIHADNAPIPLILKELSEKTGFNYFLSPDIESSVTLKILDNSLEEVLNHLFSGSEIGFRETGGMYLIGKRNSFDFNEHKVIQLQNRSIESLLEFIPEDITKNISIVEFPELNSLFVSGAKFQLEEFESFVKQIDKVVPVVMIEVIIMYINKTNKVATGIKAGLGEEPVQTAGTIFPGVDVTIGANEINRIINDMGWVNLGKVTPNFYVSLQALETQGHVDLQSTPKLATLNGHEATLAIGNTEYYLEEQTHLYGTQNPTQTTSTNYKAIKAELSLTITPVVSADEQITLNVEVHQSDFTERISNTAPPGSVNRDFTSQIRVKNQEMIILGGLMEKRKSDSGSGTPILSRIPVIKWFFSSRNYENSDSKLSVLIKPSIIN